MTAIRTLAVAAVAWCLVGDVAEAAPLSSWYGSSSPSSWYANSANSNGGFYAPASAPAATFTNSNWFNSPSYLASLGSISSPGTTQAASLTAARSASASSTPASAATATAFLNFGNAPYAEASNLTTGGAQSWTSSPAVTQAFGGTPTSAQQSSFIQSVVADIQHTFQISGMNISLTTDPTVQAPHMMSVVSGTSYPGNTGAIGITDVGANGFSFIDKLNYANTPDQLAWAVAHNLSHELMHALGVATHPDTTGQYLDSAIASWSMLTDPNTKFSPAAVQMMQAANGGLTSGTSLGAELLKLSKHPVNCNCQFCQMMRREGLNTNLILKGLGADGEQLLEAPVPEPATILIWSVAGIGGLAIARRRASTAS
ncbi:PEP-CTERM sorting domain-containing protein [Aquisphaera insulae]|uniref:PEP-CTERM sorting domain-containing protein n=1 Tax=Aquisphaera insulae TaxID=2712864 RepID=UPI0013ED71D8|nr:PEP-CTERM sorting domain-containing protein [Aquisphaera insulae]